MHWVPYLLLWDGQVPAGAMVSVSLLPLESHQLRTGHGMWLQCLTWGKTFPLSSLATAHAPHVPRKSAPFLSVTLLWSVEPLFQAVLISECFSTAWFGDTLQKSCVFSNNVHEYRHRDERSGWLWDVTVIQLFNWDFQRKAANIVHAWHTWTV